MQRGKVFFGEIYQTILEDQDLAAQFIELERRYQVKEAIHIPAKKEQQLSASDSDDGTNSENLANGQHSMASGSATVYEPVPLSDNRYGFLSETTNTVPLRSLWGEEDERIDSTSTAASAVPPYPFWSDQDELPPLMKGAPSSPFLGAAPLNEITDGDDFWTMFNREFN